MSSAARGALAKGLAQTVAGTIVGPRNGEQHCRLTVIPRLSWRVHSRLQ